MHLPDEFLHNQAAFSAGAASLGALAVSLKQVMAEVKVKVTVLQQKFAGNRTGEGGKSFGLALSQKLQDMATLGGLIFALQMVNFPVANGTSGHFLGAALATAIVGPYAAILVMAAVVAVQALFFADGGMIALGANIFNMAVASVAITSLCFFFAKKINPSPYRTSAFLGLAAWLSVMTAALACSLEIAWSGAISLGTLTASMLKVHALIGLGETLITIVAVKLFFPKHTLSFVSKDEGHEHA